MKRFILLITGPTGSGKSTVATVLAKQFVNCVNIDVDEVKHFIVTGFKYGETSAGLKQWQLLGTNLGMLATNFANAGYNVIISGYLNGQALQTLDENTELTHKILLLPNKKETTIRDSRRSEETKMGKKAVLVHHDYFSTAEIYQKFSKIDSTHLTVKKTVDEIVNLLV